MRYCSNERVIRNMNKMGSTDRNVQVTSSAGARPLGTIIPSSLSYPSDNTQVKESKTRLHTCHTSLHSSANCAKKSSEERTVAQPVSSLF